MRGVTIGLLGVLLAASCSSGSRTTPDIRLAPPPVPQFMTSQIAGWEDAVVSSLCVEVSAEGDFADRAVAAEQDSVFRGSPEDLVAVLIAGFGIPVAVDGCDARLTVEISARLIPASYPGAGTCFEGSEGRATATLSMSGRPEATGAHTHRREPPPSTQDCTSEPAVGRHLWAAMLAGDGSEIDGRPGALVDLFGDPIWLAVNLAGRESTDPERPHLEFEEMPGLAEGGNRGMLRVALGSPPGADAVAVLTARVADADRAARYFAALTAGHLAGEDRSARGSSPRWCPISSGPSPSRMHGRRRSTGRCTRVSTTTTCRRCGARSGSP